MYETTLPSQGGWGIPHHTPKPPCQTSSITALTISPNRSVPTSIPLPPSPTNSPHIKHLRLPIGNTTNRQTIEQIAQGYQQLELIEDRLDAQTYPNHQALVTDNSKQVRSQLELMEQSDESETLVKNLVQTIESKRLEVKVYTKGVLHAKAYIFDYGEIFDGKGKKLDSAKRTLRERSEQGIAIVGSSNLTLSGLNNNTELNVVIHGNDNHQQLTNWFMEQHERARTLTICPPPLMEMWERYNEKYHLNAWILSMGMLKSDDEHSLRTLLEDEKYKHRDFVLVDESHHLRNYGTQRYKVLHEYLSGQRKAYILVGDRHQYFPKRRLETIDRRPSPYPRNRIKLRQPQF